MDLLHGGAYPCVDAYEEDCTGTVITARSTREAHSRMPDDVEDIADVLGLPGVEPRSARIVQGRESLVRTIPIRDIVKAAQAEALTAGATSRRDRSGAKGDGEHGAEQRAPAGETSRELLREPSDSGR